MWLNYGRFAARLAGASILGISLGFVLDDSRAEAGFLKNSVRVGDRSAMNLVGKPTPGQKKLIRTPVFARPKADTDRDSGGGGSRGVAAQTWFWQAHSTALADASPERWAEALDSLRGHRADGNAIYDEGRLQDIARRYETDIAAAARKHGVSELLLVAVIAVESAGSDKAVSPKGARGLMQLIPATARRFGVSDSFDPAQNILGGAAYLDWLLKAFNEDPILALAGYNAGEGAVESNNGVPPYAETRDYVVKVFDALAAAEALCRVPADNPRRACGWSSSPRT
jgi:hypothetical protein